MIPDGCSVIVNIGTTTEEVARALVQRRDLVVITNNLNVVGILSGTPGKELILAGGMVRQTDGGDRRRRGGGRSSAGSRPTSR